MHVLIRASTHSLQESDLTSTDLETLDPSSSSHLRSRTAGGSSTSSNLYPYIAANKSHGLNLDPSTPLVSAVLRPHDSKDLVDTSQSIVSLSDDELIVEVKFSETVRIKSILVGTGGEGDEAPRKGKVWVNRVGGLGFDDTGDEAQMEWELGSGIDVTAAEGTSTRGAKEYPVRVSRFSDVTTLSLFFVSPSRSVYSVRHLPNPESTSSLSRKRLRTGRGYTTWGSRGSLELINGIKIRG